MRAAAVARGAGAAAAAASASAASACPAALAARLLAAAPRPWPAQRHRGGARRGVRARSGAAAPLDAAAAAPPPPGAALYDRPQLYDDAFSYRDFAAEAEFLLAAYRQHARGGGGAPATVLELGCGPANHAVQLAARGAAVWALDVNAAMLDYAAGKAAAAGVAGPRFTAVQADMAAFDLPGLAGRLDMAVCLLGTLSHMLDNAAAASCFAAVARHLRPGGLFVVELAHPGDLFDGSLLLQDTGAEMWEVDREGRQLMVMWGTDVDDFDPHTQVLRRTVSIHGMTKGGEVGECLLEEVVPWRHFTAQEVDLLATLAGLEVVGTYGDLDLGVGLTHEDAFRLVELPPLPGKMASRAFMLAAVALFAVLAAARAQQGAPPRSPAPITSPCDGNFTALSVAMTNATNTELAKSFGQVNTTSKDRSTKFTVPRICGPLGTCAGGNTFSASTGKTKTTSGAHDITSSWTLTESSCKNKSGTWTVSGPLDVLFTWTDTIVMDTSMFVDGFLGAELSLTLDTTITGMTVNAGGNWTVTSTDGVTGTLTALSFADCIINTVGVEVSANGAALITPSGIVQGNLDASGPQFCASLNKKLAPKLINKTFPLLRAPARRQLEPRHGARRAAPRRGGVSGGAAQRARSWLRGRPLVAARARGAAAQVQAAASMLMQHLQDRASMIDDGSERVLAPRVAADLVRHAGRVHGPLGGGAGAGGESRYADCNKLAAAARALQRPGCARRRRRRRRRALQPPALRAAGGGGGDTRAAAARAAHAGGGGDACAARLGVRSPPAPLAHRTTLPPAGGPPRSPAPITSPCDGNFTALSVAMTNATNTELAKSFGQVNTTSKDRSTKFTVPRICGPLGTCAGGNTFSASTGKTKTTSGAHDITSSWTLTESSCKNKSGTWTVSGPLDVLFTWTDTIVMDTSMFVDGFLGAELSLTLDTTITGMTVNAGGNWTVTSTDGVTGTLTALSFADCIINTVGVEVSANGAALITPSGIVQGNLDASGPQFCASLNKKLAPKLINKTFPLLRAPARRQLEPRHGARRAAPRRGGVSGGAAQRARSWLRGRPLVAARARGAAAQVQAAASMLMQHLQDRASMIDDGSERVLAPRVAADLVRHAGRVHGPLGGGAGAGGESRYADCNKLAAAARALQRPGCARRRRRRRRRALQPPALRAAGGGGGDTRAAAARAAHAGGGGDACAARLGVRHTSTTSTRGADAGRPIVGSPIAARAHGQPSGAAAHAAPVTAALLALPPPLPPSPPGAGEAARGSWLACGGRQDVSASSPPAPLAHRTTLPPAGAPPRSPAPITSPCDGNFTALSVAMTNATNTELAKSFGQVNTTSKDRSTKFTVPRICGPLGTCAGGNTFSASTGKTKTTSGAHDITSSWTLTESSCKNKSGTWTVSGPLDVLFTWTDTIVMDTSMFVDGFLGAELSLTLDTTITGMTVNAGGNWTVTSTDGVTGTLTALSFADCIINTVGVEVSANGAALITPSGIVQGNLDASGPQFCASLNKKLAPKLINKTFPLLRAPARRQLEPRHGARRAAPRRGGVSGGAAQRARSWLRGRPLVAARARGAAAQVQAAASMLMQHLQDRASMIDDGSERVLAPRVAADLVRHAGRVHGPLGGGAGAGGESRYADCNKLAAAARALQRPGCARRRRRRRRRALQPPALRAAGGGGGDTRAAAARAAHAGGGGDACAARLGVRHTSTTSTRGADAGRPIVGSPIAARAHGQPSGAAAHAAPVTAALLALPPPLPPSPPGAGEAARGSWLACGGRQDVSASSPPAPFAHRPCRPELPPPPGKMASRAFMLAAVALFAVLAAARAQQGAPPRSPAPITTPCDGNFTALSVAMTNATNTELAKSFGQTNTTSTDRSTKFTVPRICGPLGTCAGGNTFSASAGKTKSTSGAHNIVSAWNLTENSCFNNSGTWTVSGPLQVVFTWTDSISVNTKFFVNGFLGAELSFTVDASITGMTALSGGTWTVTSTDGITGTLTAVSFANCVIDTASVDVTADGSFLASASATVQANLDASGPQFCSALNKKLAPKLINKTFPL
ncbi:hypothetical protein HT031_001289 [Scenedesmus sp. PABB004]|nr:hypothetical protein HT031_001289 [Scenedesmus sp. PABB004]